MNAKRLMTIALTLALPLAATAQPPRNEETLLDFFEKKVRPVLANNCYNCHSANTNSNGGLRVDDRNGLVNGGGRGPAIVPGQPEKSLLIQAVRHTHAKVSMPPKKTLADHEITDLAQWIKDGAVWPRAKLPASVGKQAARYEKLRKEHWAFQPLSDPKVPDVRDKAWPRADVDRFILAVLEAKNLKPVGDADRVSLIRRVTFDLTGLPPSPADIDAFRDDASPQAFEKVVDRLLASPQFGERWGRHWLDLARFGESTGSARNLPYPNAWRYRDYVIDAFNRDKPYNQFLLEQLAGDLLPAKSTEQRNEQLIATGFLAVGARDVNQRFKVRFTMDNIDEQIDTMGRAMLGLSLGCARCHDHKFDPIPVTDYYALAGIFHSTDLCAGVRNKMGGGGLDYYNPVMFNKLDAKIAPDPKLFDEIVSTERDLNKARADLAKGEKDKMPAAKVDAARGRVKKLETHLAVLNASAGQLAMGVRDAKTIGDTEIRVRGEAEAIGPTVPRGFLSLVNVPDAAKIPAHQSGRLELAQWMISEKNPLPARVMANRVWKHLFGQGLVISVDNFGVTGDKPSHPELLDYLARDFQKDGWSVKKLIRKLVLSRAYQLSSESTPAHVAVDPANRLVWRHSPRRLDAEEIRDAMLVASGKLDLARPTTCISHTLKIIELPNNGPLAKKIEEEGVKSLHRSIYLPLLRTLVPRSLEIFDFAEQATVTGSRDATTVAPQSLYLLNDPFVRQQAQILAESLLRAEKLDDNGRVTQAYRRALGRPATSREIERVKAYLADFAADTAEPGTQARTAAWTSFCQALLASAEFRYIR